MAASESGGALGPSALIVAFLAVVGLGLPYLGNSPPPSGEKNASSASASGTPQKAGGKIYRHSASALLENFFDMYEDQFPRAKPWLSKNEVPASPPDQDNWTIRFLIATLPDPTSPPLRHQFDADLDAIQMAAQRAGYVLDSFDLPWPESPKERPGDVRLAQEIDAQWQAAPTSTPSPAGSQTPTATPTGPPTASSASASPTPAAASSFLSFKSKDDRRSDDPGVIMFRCDGAKEREGGTSDSDHRCRRGDERLLVVFVVGETPTRGVNKAALRDALDEVAWLSG